MRIPLPIRTVPGRTSPAPGFRGILTLAGAAALLAWPGTLAAQECRVQYTAGGVTTTLTLAAGEVRTLSANGLTSLVNIGNNDVTSRVAGALGATADNLLINSGSGNVVLPPAVWNGQQLQRLTCGNFGTILDAQALLTWMGGSYQNVVDAAMDAARWGAEQMQTAATAPFQPQQATQSVTQAESAMSWLEQQWAAYSANAPQLPQLSDATFQANFPELHAAIAQTNAYGLGLTASAVDQAAANARQLVTSLQALGAKYDPSPLLGALAPDPARHFPELLALTEMSCPVPELSLQPIVDRLSEKLGEVRRLEGKYGASTAVRAEFQLVGEALAAFATAEAQRPCAAMGTELSRALSADFAALRSYLQGLTPELRAVAAGRFERGQEQFQQQVVALDQLTEVLLREVTTVQALEAGSVADDAEAEGVAAQLLALRRTTESDEPMVRTQVETLNSMINLLVTLDQRATDRQRRVVVFVETDLPRWLTAAAALAQEADRLRITVDRIEPLKAANSIPAAALAEVLARLGDVQTSIAELYNHMGNPRSLGMSIYQGLPRLSDALFELGAAIGLSVHEQQAAAVDNFQGEPGTAAAAIPPAIAEVIDALEAIFLNLPAFVADNARTFELKREVEAAVAALGRSIVELPVEVRDDFAASVAADALVSDGLDATARAGEDLAECITTIRTTAYAARDRFPDRLQAALQHVAGAAVEALPEPARELFALAVADAEALVTALEGLATARQEFTNRISALHETRDALLAALMSVPQPDVLARVQAALAASVALRDGVAPLIQAANAANSAAQTFHARWQNFMVALRTAELEASEDASAIVYQALDTSILNDEYTKTGTVADAWSTASTTFPSRATAFGWGELIGAANALSAQIAAGLEWLRDELALMAECYVGGEQVRAALAAPALVTAAAGQATAGLATEVQASFEDLNALLQPSLNIMDTVAGILAAGTALQQRVGNVGSVAGEAYTTANSTLVAQLQQHVTCLDQRRVAIVNTAYQLTSQIPGAALP
jgi:hypothetical protein